VDALVREDEEILQIGETQHDEGAVDAIRAGVEQAGETVDVVAEGAVGRLRQQDQLVARRHAERAREACPDEDLVSRVPGHEPAAGDQAVLQLADRRFRPGLDAQKLRTRALLAGAHEPGR
jgi:hypothetical protein